MSAIRAATPTTAFVTSGFCPGALIVDRDPLLLETERVEIPSGHVGLEYWRIGPAGGNLAVFLAAHRPGEERRANHLAHELRHRGRQRPDVVGIEIGRRFARFKEVTQAVGALGSELVAPP